MADFNTPMPIYVTRKTADGWTGSYEVPLWMTLSVIIATWLNVMVWTIVGLIAAVSMVV